MRVIHYDLHCERYVHFSRLRPMTKVDVLGYFSMLRISKKVVSEYDIKQIEKAVDAVIKVNDDEFYLDREMKPRIHMLGFSTEMDAYCRAIYRKIPNRRISYMPELTESHAFVDKYEDPDVGEVLVDYSAFNMDEFLEEFGIGKEESTNIVNKINSYGRIFRCEQCGELTSVTNRSDYIRTKWGMPLIMRCNNCISERPIKMVTSDEAIKMLRSTDDDILPPDTVLNESLYRNHVTYLSDVLKYRYQWHKTKKCISRTIENIQKSGVTMVGVDLRCWNPLPIHHRDLPDMYKIAIKRCTTISI